MQRGGWARRRTDAVGGAEAGGWLGGRRLVVAGGSRLAASTAHLSGGLALLVPYARCSGVRRRGECAMPAITIKGIGVRGGPVQARSAAAIGLVLDSA